MAEEDRAARTRRAVVLTGTALSFVNGFASVIPDPVAGHGAARPIMTDVSLIHTAERDEDHHQCQTRYDYTLHLYVLSLRTDSITRSSPK